MPKQVDHAERREAIAHALWRVVDARGWPHATLRAVADEAGVSLGQLQHYFSNRSAMLTFALDYAAEQTSLRIAARQRALAPRPHPRDLVRIAITEMLPLHPDARATSRVSAAYVLESLHDVELRERTAAGMREGRAMVLQAVHTAIADGHIPADRDPQVETDLVLALTGLGPLLDLGVIKTDAALAAIDAHLDRLFSPVAS